MRLKPFLVAGLVLIALAYIALREPAGEDPRFVRRDFFALGTLVSISAYLEEGDTRERALGALAEVERSLAGFEKTWSPWGDGLLADINRALAAGQSIRLAGPVSAMFTRAEGIRRLTAGAFDARIGALVVLWGFDDEANFRTSPPEDAEVRSLTAALRAAPSFEPGVAFGPAGAVQWDFGGIAKGAAVDMAAEQLAGAGIRNVIVNAGGNLRVSGRRGDRAWRIGIRHPRPETPTDVLASLDSSGDEAIITSGDYERYFEFEGRRYHHILDPRTGLPAHGLVAVSVVHPDAALADAASTALFVAGPARWRETAEALGVSQAMVVTADATVQVTRALAPRLEFADGIRHEVVP